MCDGSRRPYELAGTSSYLGRGLLQIGAEDNTAFYAEEEENQDRTSEEEENEAKYKALSLKEQVSLLAVYLRKHPE